MIYLCVYLAIGVVMVIATMKNDSVTVKDFFESFFEYMFISIVYVISWPIMAWVFWMNRNK